MGGLCYVNRDKLWEEKMFKINQNRTCKNVIYIYIYIYMYILRPIFY
jgi:hypothetical protein